LGLSGRVPRRVDAATKAGLLDLLDEALDAGWTLRRVCHELELPERRAHRWIPRRARGQLADRTPGGSPMHGLLADEVAEILALFPEQAVDGWTLAAWLRTPDLDLDEAPFDVLARGEIERVRAVARTAALGLAA